ncbi:MAG TPA: parallel beta-helix domain-containing protein [Fontimonas sp.]
MSPYSNLRMLCGATFACMLLMLTGSCARSNAPQDRNPAAEARVIEICPGPAAQTEALIAFFEAREGDRIQFCEGTFEFTTGLIMANTRGVTIAGAGIDKTLLSFRNSNSKEGILATHVEGLTIEDMTVLDTPGDGVKVSDARYVNLRRVKVSWRNVEPQYAEYDATRESWANNGAYAFYPVLSRDVLVEDCIAYGSSDVGFYVGQSERVIVRRNSASWNVQGYEFENTDDSEMHDNVATNNAGGFLAVDLPGRTRFGDKNRFYRNKIFNNNIDNFAPRGTIAAAVPRGTGFIILATDQVELFENEIRDHDTLGIAIVEYGLLDSSADPRFDYFPEGLHIHHNLFANNGGNPQLPDLGAAPITDITGNPTLLPALIMLKTGGQLPHIAWDGGIDTRNADCPYPQGVVADERGKPQYDADDLAPDCGKDENNRPIRYNAYKFDDAGALKLPQNGLCLHDNSYDNLLPLKPNFANFHGTDLLRLADTSEAPHDCALPSLPATVLQVFTPGSDGGVVPTAEEVERICNAVKPGEVNRAALEVNCPRLDQYGLFSDAEDPRSTPNDGGVPFDLVTPLFSDYAVKYRVAYLPPGQAAAWRDHTTGPNAHIQFPTGTVIAKTFAFRKGTEENIVETRLLIKRATSTGVLWQGLPYLWSTDAQGRRIATLQVAGATARVEWDFEDPDPAVKDGLGQRQRYQGSSNGYQIPQANQCVTCHQREDLESGSAPIGPKVRNLNRDYDYGGSVGVRNQLDHWCRAGLMTGCPADLAQAEKAVTWNVPGSSGAVPDSPEDLEARARAYLESNCAHCHTPKGVAKSTRLSLDLWQISDGVVTPRPVNRDYGVCKSPVASGRGTGDRLYDIVPGDAAASILEFRVNNADDSAIRMPPIARSVRHDEAHALLTAWINALPLSTTEDNNCSGALGGLPLPLLAPAH